MCQKVRLWSSKLILTMLLVPLQRVLPSGWSKTPGPWLWCSLFVFIVNLLFNIVIIWLQSGRCAASGIAEPYLVTVLLCTDILQPNDILNQYLDPCNLPTLIRQGTTKMKLDYNQSSYVAILVSWFEWGCRLNALVYNKIKKVKDARIQLKRR